MKLEKRLCALTGTLLGLLLAAASTGCLASAFQLKVENPAALWGWVFLICAGYGLSLQWKQGSLVYGCLLALATGYLLRQGDAILAWKQLLQQLSLVYDRAYHWGTLQFRAVPGEGAVDLPLGIWGALIALATLRTVCLPRHCHLPVLLALIPLAACTVVTDTVPDETYLFLLLTGLVLLILPASVRRENMLQSLRLTAAALLPVVLGVGILFWAIPQEGYVNQTAVIQENLRTAAAHLPQLMENGLKNTAASLSGIPARQVDLSRLGQRIPFTYPVMEVTADQGGTLYLREQDYDQYSGQGWTATENRREDFSWKSEECQTIAIHTQGIRPVRYLPYYPAQEEVLTGGRVSNATRETDYSSSISRLPEDWRKIVYQSALETSADIPASYLSLPEATRQEAAAFLSHSYRPEASNSEKADIIAALVTDCAAYSLTPSRMDGEATDFALWFLQEAESGYCIHFATAATVLLRAANVPARYVTGYMFDAIAGETVTVTEADAHAWAEYYEPALNCWIPLEATPAGESRDIPPVTLPEARATAPTNAPTPLETEAPAPPTIPSAPQIQPEATPAPPEQQSDVLWLLLLPVLALILVVLRSVRLHLRRKRQHTGSTNAQALQRFREAERLARLLKETPAEELIGLAQKAKYSQHEITPEELLFFDSYCRSCLRRLKEKPLHKRLVYQYFYAAY